MDPYTASYARRVERLQAATSEEKCTCPARSLSHSILRWREMSLHGVSISTGHLARLMRLKGGAGRVSLASLGTRSCTVEYLLYKVHVRYSTV